MYIKKSTQDDKHSESYKIMYSKYLKSNRILMAIMMGCFRFAEDYTLGVSHKIIIPTVEK